MKSWMKSIPEAERANYARAGFGLTGELGRRPALIVVDVTLGFCGSRGLTLDQAVAEFSSACGPASWEAMPRIADLVSFARSQTWPVVYTRSSLKDVPFTGKATKSKRKTAPGPTFNDFPAEIVPIAGEWVLDKTKASGFFQTPLSSYLIGQGVDTTIICGVSTSGCVRATVVDAFSHNFRTFLIEDCCFDRSAFAHAANLFDCHAKYASVVSLDELKTLVAGARASAAE